MIPEGSEPATIDHVYGGVPPDAANVCEYGPTPLPGVNVFNRYGVVTVKPTVTDTLNVVVAVRPELSAICMPKVNVPWVVGVPAIAPVGESRTSPGGIWPIVNVQVYGGRPAFPCRVCEYGIPTTPLRSVGVWIAGGPVI